MHMYSIFTNTSPFWKSDELIFNAVIKNSLANVIVILI